MHQVVVAERVDQVSFPVVEPVVLPGREVTMVSARMLTCSRSAFDEYGMEHDHGTQTREGRRAASNRSVSFRRQCLLTAGAAGRRAVVAERETVCLHVPSKVTGNLLPGSWASLPLGTPAAPVQYLT